MMSLQSIAHLNTEIGKQAAEREMIPYVPFVEEIDYYPPFPFPNLGYYLPDGWEKTEQSWFCDKTGHGLEWEPALTVEQFKHQLHQYVAENPGHGFAITEEGEFQAYISAFRPVEEESC